MKSNVLTLVLVLTVVFAFAQPPLNKRDQQRKAEFEAQIAAEEKYEATIARADQAFKERQYKEARMAYAEAIQYNPAQEQWLTSKVNDLDILMARRAALAVDSLSVISRNQITVLPPQSANKQLEQRQVERVRPEIVSAEEEQADSVIIEASEEKIVESVPEEAPPVMDQTVSARNIQLQPKPSPASPPKREEKKVVEDFSDFENGLTEETFTMPNHTVLRIVVKEGIDVMVFKRVKHNWGGEFFFLDDRDVTRRYWEEQVAMYREKYPKD